ncbi:YbjQ family protein [Coraliomargarita parva]|uniref:YbjQ family protein n=1 Tax=Coraliomargarita parva TaxID=3014050 RepID=UPI0022B45700|nr:heavy metal-binding domain-containing protein [Coraliomargarita parva]
MKYELKLNDGTWLKGLSDYEVADQIRAGNASAVSDACEEGTSRISPIRRLIPGIERLAEEREDDPVELTQKVLLTTEPSPSGYRIKERVEIVTAECAFGMNVFKDFFVGVRDYFGGRSKTTQDTLRKSRHVVLDELKREARSVRANAVIGVSLSYSEFSGQGKSMLFIVATGTAVVLEPIVDSDHD